MNRYNIGDKVLVRSDLIMGQIYHSSENDSRDYFVDKMCPCLGKECTIIEIKLNQKYVLKEDNSASNWVDTMFVGLVLTDELVNKSELMRLII